MENWSGPLGPGHPFWGLSDMKRTGTKSRITLAAVASVAVFGSLAAPAQERVVPDTYTAVTTNMTPAGVELKADILRWSDEQARSAFIEALGAEDVSSALSGLPSLGVVWRSGSAVGTSVKYAYRAGLPDGGERVILATDKRIGATSFNPWTAGDAPHDRDQLPYTVIELVTDPNGGGTGMMSFAADVVIDREAHMLALEGATAELLTDVQLQPKPYWATAD